MAKLIQGQLSMFDLMMSKDLPKFTFSQELVDGLMRPNLQDGQTTDQSGQEVVHVNLSAMQETKKVKRTKGTFGPSSSILSEPVGPMSSWENKLRQRLANLGSMECSLIWKESVTGGGRQLFRLVPSTLRTAEIASGLWPTPTASDNGPGTDMNNPRGIQQGNALATAALWSMWPTPSSRDGKGGYQGGRIRNGKLSNDTLDVTVQHTGQAQSGSKEPTESKGGLNPAFVCWLMGFPQEWESSAPMATPLSRKSRRK